jgi:tetratricopeptide (TPR) repeat protein
MKRAGLTPLPDQVAGPKPASSDGATPMPDQPTPAPEDIPAHLKGWDRYRVDALIGVGGMGRVYKAWDNTLRRTVALKFLRGGDPAVEARFAREAQTQARVLHKNVCAVFEVGRHAEQPYIAMQYIAGQTLREVSQSLSTRERVQIMRDVAEAVHTAHKLGLIHRDIKPANILIERTEEGVTPFVTDFGLARDLEGPGVTQAGAIIGTPQYMAPEQVRGEVEKLDARTDVYGLGATLYDVLAGAPPFAGSSNLQTLYRTLNDEAPPLRKWKHDLPAALEAVVMKCLEKRPERRYSTARELAEELQRFLAGEPVLARPAGPVRRIFRRLRRNRALSASLLLLLAAVAVPMWLLLRESGEPAVVTVADFVNETRDPDFDGLSGMLITSLEQSQRLAVLTRTRMRDLLRSFGKADAERIDEQLGREVARSANADALLVASIHKFDDLYRIDLQAIDPRGNQALFSLSEEARGKASVPALIDRLSVKARRQLKGKSSAEGAPSVSAVTTASLEAYQHYFRGEELIERLRFREAQEEMRRAVAADGQFALAYYRLGYSAMWLKQPQAALQNAERAVALIHRIPERERHLVLALKATLSGQFDKAVDEYQQCLDRFPQEKEAAFNIGDLAFHGGKFEPAVAYLRKVLELDAAHERALQHLVWAYQLMGRPRDMVETARSYVQHVGNTAAHAHLSRALAAAGDLRAAREAAEQSARLFPQSALPVGELATLDTFEGHFESAQARLQPLLAADRAINERMIGLQALAEMQTWAGQLRAADATLDELNTAARAQSDLDLAVQARAMQGFNAVQLRRDLSLARTYVERSQAEGLPDPLLGYVYPYLGDFERYSAMLRSLGDPFVEYELRAFTLRKRGDHAQSIADFDYLARSTPYTDVLLFETGEAQLLSLKLDPAKATFEKMLVSWPAVTSFGLGLTVAVRPRGVHELAVALEQLNQPKLALQNYEKLLKLWSKADLDLPDLLHARERVAALRRTR